MEMRQKYIVHPTHHIELVDVLFEDDSQRPVAYHTLSEDDEWYRVTDDHFFNSEQEAKSFVVGRQNFIGAKLIEFKDILEEYDGISVDELLPDLAAIKLEDILEGHVLNSEYQVRQKNLYRTLFDMFISFMRSNLVNIGSCSFPASMIRKIYWYQNECDYSAEIILSDGQKLTTTSQAEYKFVCAVFGYNSSNTYCRSGGIIQNKEG